jgi:hypothetical protein
LISVGLNHAQEMDVGLLYLRESFWFAKKTLTTVDNLERHWMLQYTLFKGDWFFFRHHDFSIISLAQLLKPQQFFTATVVRRSVVALR